MSEEPYRGENILLEDVKTRASALWMDNENLTEKEAWENAREQVSEELRAQGLENSAEAVMYFDKPKSN